MFPDLSLSCFQISHYAGISNKRLERIGIGGRLAPKKPTLEDIDQSRLQIFRPSMFGGTLQVKCSFCLLLILQLSFLYFFLCCDIQTKTLQEILEIQKDRFPSRQLPWILTTLTDQVSPLHHLSLSPPSPPSSSSPSSLLNRSSPSTDLPPRESSGYLQTLTRSLSLKILLIRVKTFHGFQISPNR